MELPASNKQLTELYWDSILLTESSFLDPGHLDYPSFQRFVVQEVGNMLTILDKGYKMDSKRAGKSPWRHIGLSYSILYFADWYSSPIWCKNDSTRLQVVLTRNMHNVVRPLLMALLEYAANLNLVMLRLHVSRNVDGIKELLRNLNWLGGRIVSNENRFKALECLTPQEGTMFSDEKYVIIEFEC
ncbi:LADA_0D05490g1_1 [Lachancea dasiensis]|uniref:LADA_0D05490g1_1 n=1 Tax=Lachancea dasiensis TaxID=1072105 RepID=A0A1G4J5G5_9SACH|nr:LADA_0D05490g1_1 [Lachancea dasiensis]